VKLERPRGLEVKRSSEFRELQDFISDVLAANASTSNGTFHAASDSVAVNSVLATGGGQ
jgi:hypothetical protein